MMSLGELLREDPGHLYHVISKIPFPYRLGHRYASNPGFKYKSTGRYVDLPRPDPNLLMRPLENVLMERRSVREYSDRPVEMVKLSTLLYYTSGIKGFKWGYPIRMFPTAGALNSPEVFLSIHNVEGLEKGLYHYEPFGHRLEIVRLGDYSRDMIRYSLDQEHVGSSAFTVIVASIYDRTYWKYGLRAYRYILLDAGHLGMNIYLVATAIGLSTVCVGAFEDDSLAKLLNLGEYEYILMLYPIGYPR